MTDNTKFDLIVFGASGFTGRLVAEYLNKQYGANGSVRWAMAGRSEAKLAQVRTEIGVPDEVALIVADTQDMASVEAMVAQAKCIITTVGPYQLYGTKLVEACANAGVDYVDLSGEPLWMSDMIEQFDAKARETGARIVHSCGFDSIPFDLGVLFLQNAAQAEFGRPAPRVRCRVRVMDGEFSGGTAASLGASLARLEKEPDLLMRMIDPFCLANGFKGPDQPQDNKPYEDELLGMWVAPFIMAAINTKNVHRSNALMGHAYGEDFIYDEMMVAGVGEEGKAVAEFISSANPLQGENVPQPGEGPSREKREAGSYDVLFLGEMPDGTVLKAAVTGDMDPGYGSTSKMLAESAICLLEDCPDLQGGVYTSAPAMGEKLIARLVANAGMTFERE